ncbi:hypothetical protein GCM10027286_32840 [Virgibacillus ainsalahensis]
MNIIDKYIAIPIALKVFQLDLTLAHDKDWPFRSLSNFHRRLNFSKVRVRMCRNTYGFHFEGRMPA